MNKFVSTVKQPIKFFEDLIIEGGYELYKEDFFAPWEKFENDEYGGFYVSTFKEDNYLVHDFEALYEESKNNEIYNREHSMNTLPARKGPRIPELYDNLSTYDHLKDWESPGAKVTRKRLNLKDVLNYKLNIEALLSQQLISQAVSEIAFNNNSPEVFLNQQLLLLRRLSAKNEWLFKEYPTCKNHLESIYHFILDLMPSDSSHISDPDPEDDPINNILSYLKGKNEHGIQIMSEKEYHRLIEAIRFIMVNQKAPEVKGKFHIQVPIGILKYTFYILLPHLGDVKDQLIHFLINNITAFESWSYQSFKTKFSEPPTTIPDYLPPIFREKKQQQMNKYK